MMKSLVIMLAGCLFLSLAPGGLCQNCENYPSSRTTLLFSHHDHHQTISVNYTVVDDVNHSFRDSISLTMPKNSFFFDVMASAQKQDFAKFSFAYILYTWGAYITTVRGLAADVNQHTYWQLLSNDTPLELGAGCYKVSDREKLKARFTKY